MIDWIDWKNVYDDRKSCTMPETLTGKKQSSIFGSFETI